MKKKMKTTKICDKYKNYEELNLWLYNKFYSCYPIIDKNNIYMYKDGNYIRQKKLSRILNQEIKYPIIAEGKCLFQLDFSNKKIMIHKSIIKYLMNNLSNERQYCEDDVTQFISRNFFFSKLWANYEKDFFDYCLNISCPLSHLKIMKMKLNISIYDDVDLFKLWAPY